MQMTYPGLRIIDRNSIYTASDFRFSCRANPNFINGKMSTFFSRRRGVSLILLGNLSS